MADTMTSHEQLVRSLFRAIETGAVGSALREYYDPTAEQIEHPSMMRPTGGRRPLADILAASEFGARMIADQRYEVLTVVDDGERLATEFTWTGTLLIDAGDIPAGTSLVAHIAAFFVFRDGRILTQSSYDCYESVTRSVAERP